MSVALLSGPSPALMVGDRRREAALRRKAVKRLPVAERIRERKERAVLRHRAEGTDWEPAGREARRLYSKAHRESEQLSAVKRGAHLPASARREAETLVDGPRRRGGWPRLLPLLMGARRTVARPRGGGRPRGRPEATASSSSDDPGPGEPAAQARAGA